MKDYSMNKNLNLIIFALLFAFASSPIAAAPSSSIIASNEQTLFSDLTKKEVARECVKSILLAAYISTGFTGVLAFGHYIDGTNPTWNTKDYIRLALSLTYFLVGFDFGTYLAGNHSLHTLILNNYTPEPEIMGYGYESYAIGSAALTSEQPA
jgi:hypothetical protein